jgi:hypothetical protein
VLVGDKALNTYIKATGNALLKNSAILNNNLGKRPAIITAIEHFSSWKKKKKNTDNSPPIDFDKLRTELKKLPLPADFWD